MEEPAPTTPPNVTPSWRQQPRGHPDEVQSETAQAKDLDTAGNPGRGGHSSSISTRVAAPSIVVTTPVRASVPTGGTPNLAHEGDPIGRGEPRLRGRAEAGAGGTSHAGSARPNHGLTTVVTARSYRLPVEISSSGSSDVEGGRSAARRGRPIPPWSRRSVPCPRSGREFRTSGGGSSPGPDRRAPNAPFRPPRRGHPPASRPSRTCSRFFKSLTT